PRIREHNNSRPSEGSTISSVKSTFAAEQGSQDAYPGLGAVKQIFGKFSVADHLCEYFLEGHRIHSQSGEILETQIHIIVDLGTGKIRLEIGGAARIRGKDLGCGMEADVADGCKQFGLFRKIETPLD